MRKAGYIVLLRWIRQFI